MQSAVASEFAGLRIAILGAPQVRQPDGTWLKLPPLPGDLLIALALAGPAGRSTRWLREALWTELPEGDSNAVVQAVRRLRKHYVDIPKPPEKANYMRTAPRTSVDALFFCDRVAELNPHTPPATVNALLALWTDCPWARESRLRQTAWSEVQTARNRIVAHVQSLDLAARAELMAWDAFCEIFHREAAAWRGRAAVKATEGLFTTAQSTSRVCQEPPYLPEVSTSQ